MTKDKTMTITRARAERDLAAGADPTLYAGHPNKHVRAKAKRKIAQELYKDTEIPNSEDTSNA